MPTCKGACVVGALLSVLLLDGCLTPPQWIRGEWSSGPTADGATYDWRFTRVAAYLVEGKDSYRLPGIVKEVKQTDDEYVVSSWSWRRDKPTIDRFVLTGRGSLVYEFQMTAGDGTRYQRSEELHRVK
jgi:hypothetical protein